MANSAPRVSIGLPVYNGGQWLEQALADLLAQTYSNFELIVSDNASEDETREICSHYAKKDDRVSYYRNSTNLGAAYNYNRVFSLAKGEYFKWAAHDDKCEPLFVERCVAALDEESSAVLAYARSIFVDEHGNKLPIEEPFVPWDSERMAVRFAASLNPCRSNAIFGVIRSDVLRLTRLIRPYLASDRCLIAELALHGPFRLIQEPLFVRRIHSRNIGITQADWVFYDPQKRGRKALPEWRASAEHMRAVWRTQLRPAQKVQLTITTLKRMWTIRRNLLWQTKRALWG